MLAQNFHLEVKPSRLYFLLFNLACLLSLIVLLASSVPIGMKIGLTFSTILYELYLNWYAILLLSPYSVSHLSQAPNKSWSIHTKNGEHHLINIAPDTLLTRWLGIIRYKKANQLLTRSLLILPEGSNSDDYRRLIVRLRWNT